MSLFLHQRQNLSQMTEFQSFKIKSIFIGQFGPQFWDCRIIGPYPTQSTSNHMMLHWSRTSVDKQIFITQIIENSQRRLDDSRWPKIAEEREKDSSVTLIREQLVTRQHHQGDQTRSDLVISETKSRKTAYKQACWYSLPYMLGTQKVKSWQSSVKQPLQPLTHSLQDCTISLCVIGMWRLKNGPS